MRCQTDKPVYYLLNDDHTVRAVDDVMDWALAFDSDKRIVAQTDLGSHWVSNVFLGLDHNWGMGSPLVFETMAFKRKPDGELDWSGEDQLRYATWDDAVAGHEAVVKRIRKRMEDGGQRKGGGYLTKKGGGPRKVGDPK